VTLTALPTGRAERRPDITAVIAEWADWLRERLDHQWRPGEWDASLLLFIGDPNNPRTSVGVCPVTGCGATFSSQSAGYCVLCTNAYRRSGLSKEEFEATYARHNRRLSVYRRVASCAVPVCVRDPFALGMCRTHYRSWVKARDRPGIDQSAWMATLRPLGEAEQCGVLACSRERATVDGLCQTHREKWRLWSKSTGLRGNDEAAVMLWAEHQPPFLAAHVFSLSPLSPVARLEMLYVLQQRDVRSKNLSPQAVRGTVEALADVPSMAWAGVAFPEPATAAVNDGTRSLLSGVRWELAVGLDQFRGVDPTRKLVWDLRAVSQVIPSLKKGASALRNPSSLDFGEVRHQWLRSVLMHWARTAQPDSKNLRRWHLSCVIASRALGMRPGGGDDPAKLQFSDVTAVVDAFKLARDKRGEFYAPSHQRHLLGHFFDLLDFGRREGAADDLSPRFVRHPGHHTFKPADENEEEIGKAISDMVIEQLDRHIHLLGKGFSYGKLPPGAVTAMLSTAYVILRDTGRRPAEVAGLDLNCLEFDKGEYQMVWHNMKGRRLRRRLPIHLQTVDAIKDWQEIRAGLDLPGNSVGHLFPAITNRYRHLDTGNLSRSIRSWVDSIPVLDSEELGRDGTPLPFNRSKIFPYAFRHTFCQRYADAGVALHVLQALMDHRSADTTAAYFQVSKKMKREAVDTLRVLAMDRHGKPAPMASATAYEMRSVAVPWGNCVEPSNVKAGGKACPIRFQCPGCSSYRPDPSHLPSIEDQVRSLKANLEVARAMGAADYTIKGMDGEIADYLNVIKNMKVKLESMSDEERHEVEEASKVLRRLRAGALTSGPVALPMPIVRPAGEAGP
jgi:integrase